MKDLFILALFACAACLVQVAALSQEPEKRTPAQTPRSAERPAVSFGVLADIQYADKPAAGRREYRKSIEKLKECSAALQSQKLDFVIQLGDATDDGADDMRAVLSILKGLPVPTRHVVGNHDLYASRDHILKRLSLPRAYYDFSVRNWRFIVLDGMQVSVGRGWPESSPNYQKAARMLANLRQAGARNATEWNGAVGEEQREWLRVTLADAAARRQRAMVFCHFPVLAESCRPEHLLWDHREVLAVLDSAPALVAYLNGHDHRGGYAVRNGVHYLTLPGMVESEVEQSCNVAEAYSDRVEVHYPGKPAWRTMRVDR